MKLPFLSLKMMVKSGLEFILKLTEPLQICCCPVQKYLPRLAKLAWQLSRYLWRGSVNFKINSRPLFTIIFKAKNVNFKTRDFSPLIEWVLAGVSRNMYNFSEIFSLTLLFGHPYTFIRNQKKIPPTPLNGVIWSYTLIKFSDFVLLALLFGLILYSEL